VRCRATFSRAQTDQARGIEREQLRGQEFISEHDRALRKRNVGTCRYAREHSQHLTFDIEQVGAPLSHARIVYGQQCIHRGAQGTAPREASARSAGKLGFRVVQQLGIGQQRKVRIEEIPPDPLARIAQIRQEFRHAIDRRPQPLPLRGLITQSRPDRRLGRH
jgi:hypothetical protein